MKLKNLFEAKKAKSPDLIGRKIFGGTVTENTPNEIWDLDFRCANLGLMSLKGAPKQVNGDFVCFDNKLVSLEGSPRIVKGDFIADNNFLTSLEGGPERVDGSFFSHENELNTLKGCPATVGGLFSCATNKLESLEGAPSEVGTYFNCGDNKLVSLHNVHKHIKKMNGEFHARYNPITSHVLGLMLIDGITGVKLDNKEVENILNDGIKNKKHWTEVQAELEEAGFEEYAQL